MSHADSVTGHVTGTLTWRPPGSCLPRRSRQAEVAVAGRVGTRRGGGTSSRGRGGGGGDARRVVADVRDPPARRSTPVAGRADRRRPRRPAGCRLRNGLVVGSGQAGAGRHLGLGCLVDRLAAGRAEDRRVVDLRAAVRAEARHRVSSCQNRVSVPISTISATRKKMIPAGVSTRSSRRASPSQFAEQLDHHEEDDEPDAPQRAR